MIFSLTDIATEKLNFLSFQRSIFPQLHILIKKLDFPRPGLLRIFMKVFRELYQRIEYFLSRRMSFTSERMLEYVY